MSTIIKHIHAQEAHTRRAQALKLAGIVSGCLCLVWVTTLGGRAHTFARKTQVPSNTTTSATDQVANVASALPQNDTPVEENTLIVATTSIGL